MMIKDMIDEEKPREKAKKYGMDVLSTADLLAILLRTGTKNKSVKELSQDILKTCGGLKELKNMRLSKLKTIPGIGEVKAITLLATIELAKRMQEEEWTDRRQIKESQTVFDLYKERFKNETQEKFLLLCLDTKNHILEEKVMFLGTANQSLVHPRDIFREAILTNAVKVLFVHNHPSGNPSPSLADEQITKKLKEVGMLLGIEVIDHVILGKNTYYSFLEHRKGGFE